VYDIFGGLVAQYGSSPQSPCTTCYLAADHLGSTRLMVDAGANPVSRHDYLPSGEEVPNRPASLLYGATDGVTRLFTGQERDLETGLDYFEARYYLPAQSRFMSPDEFTGGPVDLLDFADVAAQNPTFYGDILNPQSLNKYAYCYNNPLRYVDPDGHGPLDKVLSVAGDFVQGVGKGVGASMSFGLIPVLTPKEPDSPADRAGQMVGTGLVALAGAESVAAGTTGAVLTAPTGAGLVIGGAVAVGGLALAGGAALNGAPFFPPNGMSLRVPPYGGDGYPQKSQ
jgi:RHS repeat-associated protein